MFDVVGLGEMLIDFTFAGKSAGGQNLFEQNPGGAPANLLTAVSHMGGSTAFIGKVGADMHGRFLKQTLESEGINTENLIMDANVFTTLAFVLIGEDGERVFSFARKPGADTQLRPDELDTGLLRQTRVFHAGSLSLTDEPSRTATYEAARIASGAGAVISYDPNYRETLWQNREQAVKEMSGMVVLSDMMKLSEEESILLTGERDFRKAAARLIAKGVSVAAITLGEEGVYMAGKDGGVLVSGYRVKAVDTTGAGDSFWGGFLSRYLKEGKRPEELTIQDIEVFAKFGNAVAALCVQKRGGIPAIPYEEEALKLMNGLT